MHRRRFYAPPNQIDGKTIILSAEETHHLVRALRMRPGDEVFVFDGRGTEYASRISSLDGGGARLEVESVLERPAESPANIILAQALAQNERFDLVVQKATALGVREIVPVSTSHGEVMPAGERAANRIERWRRISLEAAKQSGRRTLVQLQPVSSVTSAVENARRSHPALTLLVFNERGGARVDAAVSGASGSAIIVFIGPEGGWSDGELEFFEEQNAIPVSLGPRILRTETAAIAAITLVQHLLGDLSR